MDITPAITWETRFVFNIGKGRPVKDAREIGLVLAVLQTVFLRIMIFKDITNAGRWMVRKSAYHRGLVLTVAHNASLVMTTADITVVHKTEVKRVCLGGMARTAQCSVFLKMMRNSEITLVTMKAIWCAWMVSVASTLTALGLVWSMKPQKPTTVQKKATKSAILRGLGPTVPLTASPTTMKRTGITLATCVTEVKCAWTAGKDVTAVKEA